LAEERDGLSEFCEEFGFDTTLSERGDVFYHPDLHTHLSCVRETSNCHMFILIIGGRFGGKYKVDPSKSITNAEYAAAIENGSPTFAFVKQEVLNDHNVWQRNKEFPFAKDIVYPSIEKQEYAEEIFKFIDAVRLSPVNNGIFGFRLAKDIHNVLRKQWAGMMFEFLQNRGIAKQLDLTNAALGNLSVVSTKIEELVKNIYRNVDVAGAPDAIRVIEDESAADNFLSTLSVMLDDKKFIRELTYDADKALPNNWWDFVAKFGWGKLREISEEDGKTTLALFDLYGRRCVQKINGDLSKEESSKMDSLISGYEILKSLPEDIRSRIMSKYFFTKLDSKAALARANESMAAKKLVKTQLARPSTVKPK
jgi:hypothetical protein